MKICLAYILRYNSSRESQINFLMIPNKKGWHYLAIKNLRGIITKRNNSKKNGDFYCLNCLHSFRTKNKLKSHKKVYEVR